MSSLPALRYSPAFLSAIKFVLPHETEYVPGHWGDLNFVRTENVPGDSGGLTKYGIDKSSHPGVDIANLDYDKAVEIYHQEWLAHRLDLLPERLAIAAFDVYVNGGYPILWLQQSYNITHNGDLAEDNNLGPLTLSCLSKGNPDAILRVFLSERAARFTALSHRPALYKFLKGWLARNNDLRAFLRVESQS